MPSKRSLIMLAAVGSLAAILVPTNVHAAGVVGTRGNSLAIGDFDGDGLTDHAYGYPKSSSYEGKVVVVYGTEQIDVWNRDSAGILGSDANYNYFGDSVAAGDFDGDGYDDIAVGVPGDDTGAGTNVGSFHETEQAVSLPEGLPDDLFEDGWDETTSEQRQAVLRVELEQALSDMREAPEADRSGHAHRAAVVLSSLRAELMRSDEGRAEYRALEQEVEVALGDDDAR